jgi:hypothetical protein
MAGLDRPGDHSRPFGDFADENENGLIQVEDRRSELDAVPPKVRNGQAGPSGQRAPLAGRVDRLP